MSYNATIPSHDEDLYITDDTDRDDVESFVETRLETPAVLSDVVVFNFSSHSLDARALVNAAGDLDSGVYVVPYQVPGTWGYMVEILPDPISSAPLLTYRRNEEAYHVYENWRGDSAEIADELRAIYETWALGGDR